LTTQFRNRPRIFFIPATLIKAQERELRSYALSEIFSALSTPFARAQLGYPNPLWTPKEAIEKGQIVLIDGSKLINQRMLQHYLFTQVFSVIMEQSNRRQPQNPDDNPVAIVIDEVKASKNPGVRRRRGLRSFVLAPQTSGLYRDSGFIAIIR
jgi:hypothetical protein